MSVSKSIAGNSEPVYCDTSEIPWNQDDSPNIPQTVTNSEFYQLPQYSVLPPSTNGPPPAYSNINGASLNGMNATANYPLNSLGIHIERNIERNVSNLPNGIVNSMRSLNIPNTINGSDVLFRPNGHNVVNSTNGYINTGLNARYACPTTTKTNGVKKQKRNRTAFTSQQMMELEQEYARTRYLDRTRRIELSEILHLNERTIKIWFQNRRMKEKKDRAESLEDSEEVSTTESSPELGTVPMPTLIHEQYDIANNLYNRGMYGDYLASSTPVTMTTTLSQNLQNSMSEYSEYIPPEVYESQCRQVHLQVQHYAPVYNNEMPELKQEAPAPEPDSCSANASSSVTDQSWDLSWIRSIQADEEF